ncbi:hypothetical protein GWI33_015190 [Rhynchophorus ferrugineus]|uniref:Uncharacterized protein n=1 Tax=Rhynchophorus ferrugineus TaxID=354439 RepID=A0A834I311_RHYFE|nr:hypothetical protein GWI33_015190 [Rhynchophorus ferrugineus]
MFILFTLVFITALAVPSSSQSHRNVEQNPSPLVYEPSAYTKERQFLPIPRARSTEYEYDPLQTYKSEIQYQPSYSTPPKAAIKTATRRSKQRRVQPTIEQFLKEVTPTTKTAYEPSPLQYTRSSAAKQPSFEIEESQQQSYFPQQNIQPTQLPKQLPAAQNLPAYHNVLLAQQYALYDKPQPRDQETEQGNEGTPKSAIFISQTVPKKLTPKPTKPKTSTLDEEIEYLTKLQYRQLQQQAKELRIPQYSKLDLLSNEERRNERPQIESRVPVPSQLAKPIKLPRIQNYQPQYQQPQGVDYQPDITYQSEPDIELKYKPTSNYEQSQLGQYQPQENSYRGGPKYLPDQKVLQLEESRYQQSDLPGTVTIPKYQIPKSSSLKTQYSLEGQLQHSGQSPQYQEIQHQSQPVLSKQETPVYQGPTDEEYRESEVKQRLGKNSNLRILKTGKPVVFIGHDE